MYPLLYLPATLDHKTNVSHVSWLYLHLGTSWILGCIIFSVIIRRQSRECLVSRQYLCQLSLVICAVTLLGASQVKHHSDQMFLGNRIN